MMTLTAISNPVENSSQFLWAGAILVFLALNSHSLPFSWHFRLFRPIVGLYLRILVFRLRLFLHPKDERAEIERQWLERLSPVGIDPWEREVVYKTYATLDDCDFRLHVSNSSYARNLDACRLKAAVASLPGFVRAGGWIGLGGLHFTFIREIPIFSKVEQRVKFASWDNKWMYVIVRFVILPKKNKKKGSITPPSQSESDIHTPVASSLQPVIGPSDAIDSGLAIKALDEVKSHVVEPDGAIVHCIAISNMVMKIGRVTVPPAVAFACEGFSKPRAISEDKNAPTSYSVDSPPPHWKKVQAIWASKGKGGGRKAMRDFLAGGWKNVPEGERWWDEALGGSVEAKRLANLELVQNMRKGIDGFRVT